MPRFLIRFNQPVDYQPDHPVSRRLGITELLVSAPTLDHAKAHALRVTRGEGVIVDDIPVPSAAPPVEEVSSA